MRSSAASGSGIDLNMPRQCNRMLAVTFLVQGGGAVGLGHVSRSSVLAIELAETGAQVRFVIVGPPEAKSEVSNLTTVPFELLASCDEAINSLAGTTGDIIVVDGYDFPTERISHEATRMRAVVAKWVDENLEENSRNCDIVICPFLDPKLTKLPLRGRPIFFAGLQYVCLRPEFRLVENTVKASGDCGILVTFGGADRNKRAVRIGNLIATRLPDTSVRVLSRQQEIAQQQDNLEVLGATCNMAGEMAAHRLIVCPCSTTAFEALAMNRTIVAVQTATNQKHAAEMIRQAGVKVFDPDTPDYKVADAVVMVTKAAASGEVDAPVISKCIDGLGAARLAAALTKVTDGNSNLQEL